MEPKDWIKALLENRLSDLHVALPAKIEKYDPKKLEATVILLVKRTIGGKQEEIPPIERCPVQLFKAGPFVIRPPYKKGDVVQVLFNERALDRILVSGNPEAVGFTRKHSLDDAVVIGGLRADTAPELPSTNTDDLLILNTENNSKIVMMAAGKVQIVGSTVELGGESNLLGVLLDNFRTWVLSHTHSNGNNGTPTGTPIEAATAPAASSKVKGVS